METMVRLIVDTNGRRDGRWEMTMASWFVHGRGSGFEICRPLRGKVEVSAKLWCKWSKAWMKGHDFMQVGLEGSDKGQDMVWHSAVQTVWHGPWANKWEMSVMKG